MGECYLRDVFALGGNVLVFGDHGEVGVVEQLVCVLLEELGFGDGDLDGGVD